MRLEFELYTTKYLGKRNVPIYCIDKLKFLPKKYWPTKAKDYRFKTTKFSFESTEEFINMFSEDIINEGYANLYKIKGIFDFFIFWHKGDKSFFKQYPGKIFNSVHFVIGNGLECLEDNKAFNLLYDFWIGLCKTFEANYGYCYLDDSVDMRHMAGGHGICLPRVFWKSYFNKAYADAFKIDSSIKISNCDIEILENGAAILTIGENPEKLTLQTELEKSIIKSLGEEYFWSFGDNKVSPKKTYKMPELDMSEILIE